MLMVVKIESLAELQKMLLIMRIERQTFLVSLCAINRTWSSYHVSANVRSLQSLQTFVSANLKVQTFTCRHGV